MSFKKEVLGKLNHIKTMNQDENIVSDLNILINYIQLSNINSSDKKPRTKNSIDPCTQCKALRADGERCSRKKRNNEYCGTHIKGRPHGEFNNVEPEQHKTVHVFSVDINGIVYWIDDNFNVYDTVAIMENKPNPEIINTCEKIIEGPSCKYRLKN
jgi:hypothetical protein